MGDRVDVLTLIAEWQRSAAPMPMVDILRLATDEIARLREERRWVPVGERLPANEEWVEMAGTWGEHIGYFDGEQWLNTESETFDYLVTHWRKRTPGPEGDA